jgi:hypothetical protein
MLRTKPIVNGLSECGWLKQNNPNNAGTIHLGRPEVKKPETYVRFSTFDCSKGATAG